MKYARFAIVALFAVSFGVAETPKDGVDTSKWEKAKQAYIQLLSFDNPGVKMSAANFIRKYNIVEATEALKEILTCDNCEAVKVSAAMALMQIAGPEGEKVIREALYTEENEMIVAFYKVILHEESQSTSEPISSN